MCLGKCLRYIVQLVSLKFIILGLAIIVLGCLNLKYQIHPLPISKFFQVVGITLVAIGSFMIILGFCGLLGAICINKCLLTTFSATIIFLMLVEFLIGIGLFSFYNKEVLKEELKSSLQYYDVDKDIKKFWDIINSELECCGVDSIEDWGINLPNSCCKDLDINDVCHKEQAFELPCLPEMVKFFKKKVPFVLLYTGGIQLFSIITAMCLSRLPHDTDRVP